MPKGKTAVVTGSTGGIGSALCDELAKDAWSLVLVDRSEAKALEQKQRLIRKYPGIEVDLFKTDLMDLVRIEKSCLEIMDRVEKVDALYCIAGVLTSDRKLSAQGHESHYAVNTLAIYAMIQHLVPLMHSSKGSDRAMIVAMTSGAIKRGALNSQNLSDPPEIGGLMGAYAQSKMALTAMCVEIATELEKSGVLIRAIDPGPTKTSMTAGGDGMPIVLKWLAPFLFSEPQEQASKIVAAANPAAFDGRSGIFVSSWKDTELPKSISNQSLRAELLGQLQEDSRACSPKPE